MALSDQTMLARKGPPKPPLSVMETISALLSFNGGFVDSVGFFGLQGLFMAHVTGNFVTLAAALVQGSQGNTGKILALPEFVLAVAAARLLGTLLRSWKLPALGILLAAKVLLLTGLFVLAVTCGPFPDANTPAALLAAFFGIAAIAVQNAVGRVHFAQMPPTTVMTNTTVQLTIDVVDLVTGGDPDLADATRARVRRLAIPLVSFAAGCAVAAVLYYYVGFWCLAVSVLVGAVSALLRVNRPSASS